MFTIPKICKKNIKNLLKVVASGQKVWYYKCNIQEVNSMFLFKGEYNHQLDAKNRIRIPAKLKAELGTGYSITRGVDKCLYIIPKEEMDKLTSRLEQFDMYDAEKQKAIRSVLRLAFDPEEDNQGRIVLTEKLRTFAGIEKEIVFLGVGNRIEIWDEQEYQKYYENEDFNSVVSSLIK